MTRFAISDPAVILVGGKGTRLGIAADGRAKPLVEVDGRPFLDYLLMNLARCGFRRCVLLCCFRAAQFHDLYGARQAFGMTVDCLVEERAAGTGGAVTGALDQLGDRFLLLNGDSFFGIDPVDLRDRPVDGDWAVRMALREVPDTARYGCVETQNGMVVRITEKGSGGPGTINAGVYWLRPEALADAPKGPSSLERDILPGLIDRGLVRGWTYDASFIDIGVPADLARARRDAAALFGDIAPAHCSDRNVRRRGNRTSGKRNR